MDINWFPGHMAKSMRDIESSLKACDCVLYVLDSRAVRSCFNPSFDKLIDIPTVYILNKSDVVAKACTDGWIAKLGKRGYTAISVEGNSSACRKSILAAVKNACASVLEKQKSRGVLEHVRAMVLGVPNTGKSTVINTLCGRAKLVTGNRAGVTRSVGWSRVDASLDVLDTPGTLYPKITDRRIGENLAIIGSIKDEVIDRAELAAALINRLNAIDAEILRSRYGETVDAENGLTVIAQKRGFKIRGGEADSERAAVALLDDYRKCRLGKIALEYAEDCNE